MPRGNDSKAAEEELHASLAADSFAQGLGNAEELIDANNRQRTVEILRATLKKTDEEATAEARAELDSYSGPDGEDAEDVAVKTDGAVVVVYEDEQGRLQKHVAEEGGKKKKASGAKAKADDKADEKKAE